MLTTSRFMKNGTDAMDIVRRIICYLLGILFLLSGLGKLYMLGEFSLTICSVVAVPYPVCRVAAICVVAAEIIGGIFLIRRRALRIVAAGMMLLVAAFIGVLASVILADHQIVCNCFGIFNVQLDNRHELILDIVLLDLFVVLILAESGVRRWWKTGSQVWKYGMAGLGIVLLFSEYQFVRYIDATVRDILTAKTYVHGITAGDSVSTVGPLPAVPTPAAEHPVTVKNPAKPAVRPPRAGTMQTVPDTIEETLILRFLSAAVPAFRRGSPGNRMLLLVNFHDFDCHICLDDFMRLSRLVNKGTEKNTRTHVAALFQKCIPQVDPDHREDFDRWLTANGIGCPSFILPDSIYASVGFEKSTIIILDSLNQILFSRQFPLGELGRNEALKVFNKEQ